MDNNTSPIISAKLGRHITIRILRIEYDAVLTCSTDCPKLVEAEDGTIVCEFNEVNNIANYQSRALVIDYEIILGRTAWKSIDIYASNFTIIDAEGDLHRGDSLCSSLVSPKGFGEDGYSKHLYPGSRTKLRLLYKDVSKKNPISSIIFENSHCGLLRFDAGNDDPAHPLFHEVENRPEDQDDYNEQERETLLERIENLEETVQELQDQVESLKKDFDEVGRSAEEMIEGLKKLNQARETSYGYKPIQH